MHVVWQIFTTACHLALEVEDGWFARVSHQLVQVAATASKVQSVFRDVVGEVSQPGILPALLQSCLALSPCEGSEGKGEGEGEGERGRGRGRGRVKERGREGGLKRVEGRQEGGGKGKRERE